MANYDGDIQLTVDLTPGDVQSTASALRQEIDSIFAKSANMKTSTQFKQLSVSMSKSAQRAEQLSARIKSVESARVPTAEYQQLQSALEQATNQASRLQERMDRFVETGGKRNSTVYKRMEYDAAQLANTITRVQQEQARLVSSGDAFRPGSATEEYRVLVNQLNDVNNQLVIQKTRAYEALGVHRQVGSTSTAWKSVASGIQTATKGLAQFVKYLGRTVSSGVSNAIHKLGSAFSNLGKNASSSSNGLNIGFKTLMRYGLGIRSTFFLVRRLRSVLIEGFKDIASVSTSFNASMTTFTNALTRLKGSFVAAFAPIAEYVMPILASLMDLLSALLEKIATFFALLTGQNKIFKVATGGASGYGSALGGANKEAEKLQKTLAGFDDVEILKGPNDSGGSGGGGGGAGSGGGLSFEEIPIANALGDFQKKLLEIWDVFKKAWEQEGEKTINAAKRAFNSLKNVVTTVGNTLYKVFTDGYGFDWLVAGLQLLQEMLDLLADIGDAFVEAWNDDNKGYKYIASLFSLFTLITNILKDIVQKFRDAWNDNGRGSKVIGGILELLTTINELLIIIGTSFKNAFDDKGRGEKLFKRILDLVHQISSTINTFVDSFAKAWKEGGRGESIFGHILEIASNIIGTITNIAKGLEKAWKKNDTGQRIWEKILDLVNSVLSTISDMTKELEKWAKRLNFSPLLNAFDEFLDKLKPVVDILLGGMKWAWTNILLPLSKWYIEEKAPAVLRAIGAAFNVISAAAKVLQPIIGPVWEVLKDLFGVIGKFKIWKLETITEGLEALADALEAIAEVIDEHNLFNIKKEFNMEKLGSDTAEGFINGLEKSGGNTKSRIAKTVRNGLFGPVVDTLIDAFSMHSPSRVMMSHGQNVVQGFINGMESKKGPTKNSVSSLITSILGLFTNTNWTNTGASVTSKLKSGFSSNFGAITTSFSTTITNIKNKFTNTNWSNIGSSVTSKLNSGVNTGMRTVLSSFTNKISSIKSSFTNTSWSTIGSNVTTNISKGLNSARHAISNSAIKLKDAISSAFSRSSWTSIGSNIAAGIGNGINSSWSWLRNQVANLASRLLKSAKSMLGIRSPSKLFRDEVGAMIPAGIAVGVDDNSNLATGAVGKLSAAMANTEFTLPKVVTGSVVPYSVSARTANATQDLIKSMQNDSISREDLRSILTDMFTQFMNISFYMGDEEVARHSNAGNERLNQRYRTVG